MVEDAISFWTEIQRYEDRLAAEPGSLCFVELSELYRKLGLLEDAVSVARKGSGLHPDYPAGFYVLGTSCYAKGLNLDAREALERTLELEPGHLEASRLLARIYVDTGELARAGKLLQEILRRHPDDVEAELLLRSIGGEAGSAGAEEEQLEELEEVEVIEELTEVLDEPQEEAAPVVPAAAPHGGRERVAAAPEPASAVRESDPFAIFEDESPLWDADADGDLPVPDESRHSDDWSDFFASPPATEPTAAQHPARDPLTTATLAELYVTQGFIDKALGIYRELQVADPANQSYRARCAELEELKRAQAEAPAAVPPAAEAGARKAPSPAAEAQPQGALPPLAEALPRAVASPAEPATVPRASQDAFETELCHWLENIRRRRDGV